ncbi:MAG: hypothetical protein QOG15_2430 [Solirubrobacteraceae bacterium]|jgi:hypothetical protein|nr:hypothetical protein [Solirubrobacteraceae bacterium]
MDQVSRPVLIALAAVVALAAIWLVALRPKPVDVKNTPLAPVKAIPAAKQAGAASDAANAKIAAASGGSATANPAAPAAAAPSATATPGTSATATPKTSTAATVSRGETKNERMVLNEIRHGKVVVMLFWSADSADDVATRGAVRGLDRHHGKVMVHVIPISRVGDYGSITRGVKIAQSPTTLIIGKKGQTRTIVGLSEPKELGQAVGDAIAGR